jgi:uncharacterized protein YjiS (DUF1127 family)
MLIAIMKLIRPNAGFRALQTACTALWHWQQERRAAAELHAMSDYSLRDIGIARNHIDEQVRLPPSATCRRTIQPD